MKTKILLELVPRTKEQLTEELEIVSKNFPAIKGINLPDLLRFPMRSWEATTIAQKDFSTVIPHLRAIDFDLEAEELPIIQELQQKKIKEVLVIKGDPPQDMSKRVYPNSSIKFIRRLKKELPQLKIHGAIDQYRSGIKEEFDYIEMKKDVGVEGFFTQPFFDLRLIDIYAEKLRDTEVYWGISPVTSVKSKNYWESRNRAYFPDSFQLSLEWNIEFAREVVTYCQKSGFNLYLMPIRTGLEKYLEGVFLD